MIKNKKIIGSAIILLIFAVFALSSFYLTRSGDNDVNVVSESKAVNKTLANNYVDTINTNSLKKEIKAQIFGEVIKPGVYTLKQGDRVKDLVDIAGGFTDNADYYSVNGAKKVIDGDNVEIKNRNSKSEVKTSNTTTASSSSAAGTSEKLDINSASADDIVNKKIPGIGKGLAAKIVQYRENNNGHINSQKDLESAIGPKRAEKLMNYVEIN